MSVVWWSHDSFVTHCRAVRWRRKIVTNLPRTQGPLLRPNDQEAGIMKRPLWVAIAVIVVAASAATYYYTRDVEAEAPEFTSAPVSRGDVVSTVEATGTLEAVTTVQVGSQ